MKKSKLHKIEKLELIKVEKNFNPGHSPKYYYNLTLQDIEESLLLVLESSIAPTELVGKKIKYYLNEDNVISNFELS